MHLLYYLVYHRQLKAPSSFCTSALLLSNSGGAMKSKLVIIVCFIHFLHLSVSTRIPHSILQISPKTSRIYLPSDSISGDRNILIDDSLYCESWKFTVETNDASPWSHVPSRCLDFVQSYITGDRYSSDSEAVADAALAFAKSVNVSGDGKDAWVFDIDETLLSNVPYYSDHGFGSETFNEQSFNDWVDTCEAPALPASLRLYLELKKLGFTIILLTGREESQRNATEKNLDLSGYSNWKRLFLRGLSDKGKLASIYKSEKRKELVDEGYRIHGNSGDQWSDLVGFAVAKRSFKLPNPLYYIP